MKIFGSSLFQRRSGETSALGEFNFQVTPRKDTRPAQLEVDCFKKKREFYEENSFSRKSIHKVRQNFNGNFKNLKYENDSDYGSMPREQENEVSYDPEKLLFHKPEQIFDLIPLNRDVTQYEEDFSIFRNYERVKVQLHPEEEWARNAKTVWWTIKFSRLWKNICIVTESSIGGSLVFSTEAKLSFCQDDNVKITGTFNRIKSPDFELTLTSKLSENDNRRGYVMIGSLKQGLAKDGKLETTHYATVMKNDLT
ncbi:uncharacterized protein LOC120347419 [Styela clava]